MTTTSQAVVAGTYECTQDAVIKMKAYANKMGGEDLKRLSPVDIEDQVKKIKRLRVIPVLDHHPNFPSKSKNPLKITLFTLIMNHVPHQKSLFLLFGTI